MQQARYTETSSDFETEFYRHYALNFPLYTHFTSPIRRYPDIIVHRLVQAALEKGPAPYSPLWVHEQAENSNRQKIAADNASDQSDVFMLEQLLKDKGPMIDSAVVVRVTKNSFELLLENLGLEPVVKLQQLDYVDKAQFDSDKLQLNLKFKNPKKARKAVVKPKAEEIGR